MLPILAGAEGARCWSCCPALGRAPGVVCGGRLLPPATCWVSEEAEARETARCVCCLPALEHQAGSVQACECAPVMLVNACVRHSRHHLLMSLRLVF